MRVAGTETGRTESQQQKKKKRSQFTSLFLPAVDTVDRSAAAAAAVGGASERPPSPENLPPTWEKRKLLKAKSVMRGQVKASGMAGTGVPPPLQGEGLGRGGRGQEAFSFFFLSFFCPFDGGAAPAALLVSSTPAALQLHGATGGGRSWRRGRGRAVAPPSVPALGGRQRLTNDVYAVVLVDTCWQNRRRVRHLEWD